MPLALLLLGAAESTRSLPPAAILCLGAAMSAGRAAHAFAFLTARHSSFGARQLGMVLTMTPMLILACAGIARAFR